MLIEGTMLIEISGRPMIVIIDQIHNSGKGISGFDTRPRKGATT
jgi:hypothetical protein